MQLSFSTVGLVFKKLGAKVAESAVASVVSAVISAAIVAAVVVAYCLPASIPASTPKEATVFASSVPAVESQAPESRPLHPTIHEIVRIRAAKQWHRQHGGNFLDAYKLSRSVPAESLQANAAEHGVTIDVVTGNLPDWIAAHQQLIEQLVHLLLILMPLFF